MCHIHWKLLTLGCRANMTQIRQSRHITQSRTDSGRGLSHFLSDSVLNHSSCSLLARKRNSKTLSVRYDFIAERVLQSPFPSSQFTDGTTSSPRELFLLLLLYYSQAKNSVIQKSMSLRYEPSSEPPHISGKSLFLNRELYRSVQWFPPRSVRSAAE